MGTYGVKLFTVVLCLLSISANFAQIADDNELVEPLLNEDNPAADTLIADTNSPDIEIVDFDSPGVESTNIGLENDIDDFSGDGEESASDASTNTNDDTTTATEAPAPGYQCIAAGTFTNPSNCNEYITCRQLPDGTFEQIAVACPANMAYNNNYHRCTRDLSDCQDDGITCVQEGTHEAVSDNTTYWWCTQALLNGGFHKFLVKCPENEYYWPAYGHCFYDLNNLPTFGAGIIHALPKDIDVVKAELKRFKLEQKQRLNEEKLKIKQERKKQKMLEKQAKKDAKAKAKLIDSNEEIED